MRTEAASGSPRLEVRTATDSGFEEHAQRVLSELRDSFAAVVSSAPGNTRRAVDFQRTVEVDAPLAWRVFKVATSDDPLAAASYIPTRGQFATLLDAASRRGLPPEVLDRARAAMEAHESLLRDHAGDRDTLLAMISAIRPGETSQIDEKTRRTAFKQNAQIWGLQAQTAVRAFILFPGAEAGVFGSAGVAGLIGFHAVRPGIPLVVHATANYEGVDPRQGSSGRAVHAYNAKDRSGLLMDFSTPGVEFDSEVGEDKTLTTRVSAPGIGRRGAVTTFALSVSEIPDRDLHQVTLGHGTLTPAERCHVELLTPVGLTDPGSARMAVYGRRTRVEKAAERRPEDLLPIHEPVVHIGPVASVPPLPGVPRWPEVIRHVLAEVGAEGVKFDVYRCSVPYPVLHTLVSLQVDVSRHR